MDSPVRIFGKVISLDELDDIREDIESMGVGVGDASIPEGFRRLVRIVDKDAYVVTSLRQIGDREHTANLKVVASISAFSELCKIQIKRHHQGTVR